MPLILPVLLLGGLGFLFWKHRSGVSVDSSGVATGEGAMPGTFSDAQYPSGSDAQVALFEAAAEQAGVPTAWASDPGLQSVLHKESNGWVGIPNYQFGDLSSPNRQPDWPGVWRAIQAGSWKSLIDSSKYTDGEKSSATGLGQLTASNIPKYYPSGLDGIGSAIEEAVGMLSYIRDRYKSPAAAWAFWQAHNWY